MNLLDRNGIPDELSVLALEYKKLMDSKEPKDKKRCTDIFKRIQYKFTPFVLKQKKDITNKSNHYIFDSLFNYAIAISLSRWKCRSPFGPYLIMELKGLRRQYLTEISPVNRKHIHGSVSYENVIEKGLKDRVDSDEPCIKDEEEIVKEIVEKISINDLSDAIEF